MSAHFLLEKRLHEIGETRFQIKSAGTHAVKQSPHPAVKQRLSELGIDCSTHTQTWITQELCDWADTIICMADYHQFAIKKQFHSYAHLYNDFAIQEQTNVDDVDDVMDTNDFFKEKGHEHARNIVNHINDTTPKLAEHLQERHFLFEDFATGKRQRHLNGAVFQPLLENEHALAFLSLDIPATQDGHVLVIPKKRYMFIDEIPLHIQSDMNALVAKVGKTLKKYHAGYNVLVNNGRAAGQYIYHTHIHVVPRDLDDDIEIEVWDHTHPEPKEWRKYDKLLRDELASSDELLKGSNDLTSSMKRVAINGFGRIGRMVFRAGLSRDDIDFIAINDLTDTKTLAYLLKYDSVHGVLDAEVSHDEQHIIVDGKSIRVYSQRDPEQLPWHQHDIDVVVESTGFFRTEEAASKHITAGAKKVIISAPAKGGDVQTIVKGINEHHISSDQCVFSNASCTTNCLGLVVKVLHDNFSIQSGYFNTIHSYTGDQNHVDGPHKDLRRGRACAENIVPTSSGAAIAVSQAIPELEGRITGMATRVPTPDGSLTDFTCLVETSTSVAEVNQLFRSVAEHHMKGVLRYTNEELVSRDIIGDPHSAIVDGLQTEVLDGKHIRVVAWYDNEWGYSNRVIDILTHL